MRKEDIVRRLETVFQHEQAVVLADTITDAYDTLVKASDFSELKMIVAELGEAQKRTEERLEELAEAQKRTEERVEELAEAQKRTEETLAGLVEAQKRTEKNVADLAKAIQLLTRELRETRRELGGLSRSVSYALENEAYRFLCLSPIMPALESLKGHRRKE
jgi:predicted  nucleic acid-binding Zn-ribbon protein